MMKNSIALPPFHIVETTKFTVEADHELTQTLQRYQAYYQEAYGAPVTEADLLREMARRFMAEDKDFQGFGQKRRRARRKALVVATPKTGPNDQLGFAAARS